MATYIHGNTVRKENPSAPVVVSQPKKATSVQVNQNRTRALHINRGYVTFLAISAILAMFVCVRYLQLHSNVAASSSKVTAMQQQLSDLQEENAAKQDAISNSMNLEEVRKRAMKDLHMVYATDEQIITYKNPLGNDVTQYSAIPENGVLVNAASLK